MLPRSSVRPSRKRHETRAALIEAARSLVLERGHQSISIQDITTRADVGLGTFYNYFEHKEDVFEAVLDAMRAELAARLEELRAPLKDPAFIVAVTLRYCFREAQDNEDWQRFISCAGLDGEHDLHQDEAQCLADIERGAAAGRFKVADPAFAQSLILGMVRHVNAEIRAGRLGPTAIDDAIQYILRMLGLPDLVARALVQTPMPETATAAKTVPARTIPPASFL